LQKKHGEDRNLPRIDGFEASKEYQKVEEQTSKNVFPLCEKKRKTELFKYQFNNPF